MNQYPAVKEARHRSLRNACAAIFVAIMTMLASCDSPVEPGDDQEPQSTAPFLLSNALPRVIQSSENAVAPDQRELGLTATDFVTYVSLPPGAIPDGREATIRNTRGGSSVVLSLDNGGFDPVALVAQEGDSLALTVTRGPGSAPTSYGFKVPKKSKPRVVRIDPPPQKRDVPLLFNVLVVFSEPIDVASLTGSSVELRNGNAPVSGALSFTDASHTVARFVPDSPLAAETEYQLLVSNQIRDLDGDALEASVSSSFTTAVRVGSISVTTVTTGVDADVDGYVIVVNDQQVQAIGPNAEVTLPALPIGNHRIRLMGRSSNCTGGDEVTREVTENTVTNVSFPVTCVARAGSIEVTAVTTGADIDADGYTITIDDVPGQPLGSNQTVTIAGVSEGSRRIRLTGLASNCSGGSEVTRTVIHGGTTTVTFSIACVQRIASIVVTTVTTGANLDPDGYFVVLDGEETAIVQINSQITLMVPTDGLHRVRLAGLSANCSGGAEVERTLTLGVPAQITFSITCSAATGTLAVFSNTTGNNLDLDGYTVLVDNVSVGPLPPNGELVTQVQQGTRNIRLTGVAPNCVGGGEVSRFVSFAGTTAVTFNILCVEFGTVRINVTTSGSPQDANGYRFSVQSHLNHPLPLNGSRDIQNVVTGSHTSWIDDVAGNCNVMNADRSAVISGSQSVVVAANAISEISLHVECAAPSMIAYSAVVAGNSDIYTVMSDGTGITRLTTAAGADDEPDWSKAGQIAFSSTRTGVSGIYSMNADGSNQTRLSATSMADKSPSWSPDGSRIAFISTRHGNAEIYVMNADGSGVQRLTNTSLDEADPAWSPDGSKIAFARYVSPGNLQIHVMNADGSGVQRKSFSGLREGTPDWSPDGSTIAFLQYQLDEIYMVYLIPAVKTMPAGLGGAATMIAWGDSPSWSADGTSLVYRSTSCAVPGCSPLARTSWQPTQGLNLITSGPLFSPAVRR